MNKFPMKALESRLEYYELLMTMDSLDNIKEYELPEGYSYSFWHDDLESWLDIHIRSGEFPDRDDAMSTFQDFYSPFINEVEKRCFFIVENSTGRRVATATISPANDRGYPCVVDWLAIDKGFWGERLSRPLISRTLGLAKALGYSRILLHTQTHTWLAAKLYLDFGFKPLIEGEIKGWQILKTITNHPALDGIVGSIPDEEMYFADAINIVENLDKMHTDYTYGIWHKNGRHDVWVREDDRVYRYKYYDGGKTLKLEP